MNFLVTTAETAEQQSSSTKKQNCSAFAGLVDISLADWLNKRKKDKKQIVLVHAGTICKVYEKNDTTGGIQAIDPESKAKRAFKALAKNNLLFTVELSHDEIAGVAIVNPSWSPQQVSEKVIDELLERRKSKIGRVDGRGDTISFDTANSVWADAGGCCMFKGCGQDLSVVPLHNKGARVAYLAHIIASDPDGPRGTVEDSHRLSNSPENIMLMCDAHHRLIDAFAPESYTAAQLQAMRREHTEKVRMYRKAMRYPEAQVITLFGHLAQIATSVSDSVILEVLLSEGLSMRHGVKRHLEYQNRDARTSADFWGHYLNDMELRIRSMIGDLESLQADALAIFPIHHTPTLVLAGRITGEARQVHVFQKSRKRDSWIWDRDAAPHPLGTFKVFGETDRMADEVLLTVELTADVDMKALPSNLANKVANADMPWIRLTLDVPDCECLQRKEDLEQVVNVARKTINLIQDKVRAKSVHLIVLSPASAAFSIGQLMQAGHHSDFILYDRSDRSQTFQEAFTITGHRVVPPAGSEYQPITIR